MATRTRSQEGLEDGEPHFIKVSQQAQGGLRDLHGADHFASDLDGNGAIKGDRALAGGFADTGAWSRPARASETPRSVREGGVPEE